MENINPISEKIREIRRNRNITISELSEKIGVSKTTIIEIEKGTRKEADSQHGVIDSDLLEIVRDRLKAFQAGPFASEYNEKALEHLELALMYLNRRVEDRIERDVLGTYNK